MKKFLLPIIAVFLLTCFLTMNVQKIFPNFLNARNVLASLIFFDPNTNQQYHILKVKDQDRIWVEIYQNLKNSQFQIISQIDTKNKYDGYFLLGGNATNLAYVDIDDDARNEIIVPGFDQNLTAYLNVIRFDSATKTFTLLTDLSPHIN